MEKKSIKKQSKKWVLTLGLTLVLVVNGSFAGWVYAEEYVASIGETSYQTLAEAITAVGDGETIRMLNDVTVGSELETGIIDKPEVSFTLDLGSNTLSGDTAEGVLHLLAGAVTIHNGTISNVNPEGSAVWISDSDLAKVDFPVGFVPADIQASEWVLPAGYPIQFTYNEYGTVRYGSATGPVVAQSSQTLYAAGTALHDFYFVSKIGYRVGTLTLDGASQTISTHYAFKGLSAGHEMQVTFTKKTYIITPKVYAGDIYSPQAATITPASKKVEYGGSASFTIQVAKGYLLKEVFVNGSSVGSSSTFTISNVTKVTTVTVALEKTALFIMLDAGHYAFYNHSPVVSSYYEGNQMWILHKYVEQELEKYPGIIVETTRPDNTKTIGSLLGPTQRGEMGKGYDLVLSLHSNACSSPSVNYVVGLCTLDDELTTVSQGLGKKLTAKVTTVMGITQTPRVYLKAQSDGRDWYGLNRGAADVGVPSVLIEHSFHTNTKSTNWLLQNANLAKIAVAEAEVIADYYGIAKDGTMAAPRRPLDFSAFGYGYDRVKIRWGMAAGATGYQLYRATSRDGNYTKVITTSNLTYLNTGLSCGTNYYYKVRAYRATEDGVKYSTFSAPNWAKPIPSRTAATLSAGSGKVVVKWTAIRGAQGYEIYRGLGTTGKMVKVKTMSSSGLLQWTNIGLNYGKTYTYQVRAFRLVNGKTVYGNFSYAKVVKTN